MQRIHSHIRNAIEALKAGDTGSCASAMECAAKLVEEKLKADNSASAPYTQDGVRIVPGMELWHRNMANNDVEFSRVKWVSSNDWLRFGVSKPYYAKTVYSTEGLAREALAREIESHAEGVRTQRT